MWWDNEQCQRAQTRTAAIAVPTQGNTESVKKLCLFSSATFDTTALAGGAATGRAADFAIARARVVWQATLCNAPTCFSLLWKKKSWRACLACARFACTPAERKFNVDFAYHFSHCGKRPRACRSQRAHVWFHSFFNFVRPVVTHCALITPLCQDPLHCSHPSIFFDSPWATAPSKTSYVLRISTIAS